jgi:hypothetical protein
MTDRAGRWATTQVGRHGRTVNEVAGDLGCDWHTVNDAVIAYGPPLVEDPDRIGQVTAVGLDEVLFARQGRWRTPVWSTSIADVATGQLLDVIEGRSAAGACSWFADQPARRRPAQRVCHASDRDQVGVDDRAGEVRSMWGWVDRILGGLDHEGRDRHVSELGFTVETGLVATRVCGGVVVSAGVVDQTLLETPEPGVVRSRCPGTGRSPRSRVIRSHGHAAALVDHDDRVGGVVQQGDRVVNGAGGPRRVREHVHGESVDVGAHGRLPSLCIRRCSRSMAPTVRRGCCGVVLRVEVSRLLCLAYVAVVAVCDDRRVPDRL